MAMHLWMLSFNLSTVAQDPGEREDIRRKLATGTLPGITEHIPGVSEITAIIGKCWSFDPAIRPTATSVSDSRLSSVERLSLPRISGLYYQTQLQLRSGSQSFNESDFQTHAIDTIKIARRLNEKSAAFIQSSSVVDSGQFQALLESDDPSSPVTAFVIGGVLFWNLCELFPEIEIDQPLGLCHGEEGI
jgi:hypothetical protein